MRYSVISDGLIVGSCPVSGSDVDELAGIGVTAVLNLQMDDDFEYWGVNIKSLEESYKTAGIRACRYPIRDFDVEDLRNKLPRGVKLLTELLREHKVYLHCSAGVNRSPTIAIAYLMEKMNVDTETAVKYFESRHYCEPYIEALEK